MDIQWQRYGKTNTHKFDPENVKKAIQYWGARISGEQKKQEHESGVYNGRGVATNY